MRGFIIAYTVMGILAAIMYFFQCMQPHPREREAQSVSADVICFVTQVGLTIWGCKLLGWL